MNYDLGPIKGTGATKKKVCFEEKKTGFARFGPKNLGSVDFDRKTEFRRV